MRRLILLRHAKSTWSDPTLSDHDRPLNQRGRLAAPLMGAFMTDEGLIPDRVVLSSSARTKETWERAKQAFPVQPDKEVREDLYLADPHTLLEVARALPDAVGDVLMIAHNPGIASFARKLANGQTKASCARAFQHFPTAAVAVLEADIESWRDLAFSACDFTRFAMPKELV